MTENSSSTTKNCNNWLLKKVLVAKLWTIEHFWLPYLWWPKMGFGRKLKRLDCWMATKTLFGHHKIGDYNLKGGMQYIIKNLSTNVSLRTEGDQIFCYNDENSSRWRSNKVLVTKLWVTNNFFGCFTYGNQKIWRQLKPSFINKPHFISQCLVFSCICKF